MSKKSAAVALLLFGVASCYAAAYACHINHWSAFVLIVQALYCTVAGAMSTIGVFTK